MTSNRLGTAAGSSGWAAASNWPARSLAVLWSLTALRSADWAFWSAFFSGVRSTGGGASAARACRDTASGAARRVTQKASIVTNRARGIQFSCCSLDGRQQGTKGSLLPGVGVSSVQRAVTPDSTCCLSSYDQWIGPGELYGTSHTCSVRILTPAL